MPDPAEVRVRLLAAGARPGFAGLMVDRRYDREGTLVARDEVLRLRAFIHPGAAPEVRLGWKGPTGVSPDGYKVRRELEYELRGAGPEELLEALGYSEVYRIERYVEYYRLGETDVRLEWYPRMDVLIEIEGDQAGIEAALGATGIPRRGFSAEPLNAFADRYASRTGTPAVLATAELHGESPSWESR